MQAFWESDFERFSLKVKEHIKNKIEKKRSDTVSIIDQKREKAKQDTSLWLQKVRSEWLYELKAKERHGKNDIAQSVKKELSIFRNDKEAALIKAFKELLEVNFTSLAECFIRWILNNYKSGVFTVPKRYEKFIDSERYGIETSELNQIVFSSENLYIEYSVKRIIEEFYDEIIDCIQNEENKWLK